MAIKRSIRTPIQNRIVETGNLAANTTELP